MDYNVKQINHYNKRILSPPVTPEQYMESCFMKPSMSDHYNASTMPLSPPHCSMASPPHTNRRHREPSSDSSFSGHSMTCYPNKRKQKKPTRSPPSSTKGTFRMPLELLAQTLNQTPPNLEIITAISSTEGRKRRRGNDCITSIQALEQEEQQKELQENAKAIDTLPLASSITPPSPSTSPSPSLPPAPAPVLQEEPKEFVKKSGTGAAHIYDNLSADCDQATLFLGSEEWIPSLEVFNRKPTIRVSWKGSPLKIKTMPYFDRLHAGEATIAAALRLTPEQYLKCKWALVLAAKEANETGALFRKSEAQKVCCIDVNKTSVLWNTFGRLGWLGSKWPQ